MRRRGRIFSLYSLLQLSSTTAMLSLFKNHPCDNFFNDNLDKVIQVAAEGGDTAVRAWAKTNWLVFRMLYKSWIDEMSLKNSRHTEKYLKDVVFFLLVST